MGEWAEWPISSCWNHQTDTLIFRRQLTRAASILVNRTSARLLIFAGSVLTSWRHCLLFDNANDGRCEQVRMYSRSGTGGTLLHRRYRQTLHLPGGNTFLREMTSWLPSWKCDVKSKTRLRQSMRIYLTNILAKFHPDPIWNDGALGFFWRVSPNKNKKKKKRMSTEQRYEINSWSKKSISQVSTKPIRSVTYAASDCLTSVYK